MPAKKVLRRVKAKTLLQKAGTHEVAEHFGVTPRTVKGWVKNGVPKTREVELKRLKKIVELRAEEKKRFLKMVKAATQKGYINTIRKPIRRKRDGANTNGIEVIIPINSFLDDGVQDIIVTAIKTTRIKSYGHWIITLDLSDLAEINPGGYKTVYPQIFNIRQEGFASQNILTSGAWPSKNLALFSLLDKLSKYRKIALMSQCSTLEITSYRYKSEVEAREFRTRQRQLRATRAAHRPSKKKRLPRTRHRVKKG